MLPICYVCLRSNKKLRSVDDDIQLFFDELCEFNSENFVQFCLECLVKLKKCYEFKNNCLLAAKILRKWRVREVRYTRKPINCLYTEMPAQTQLGLSNSNNFKVFIYQSVELDKTAPTQIFNTHPNIITVNIPIEDNNFNTNEQDNNVKQELVEFAIDFKQDKNNEMYDEGNIGNDNETQNDDDINVDICKDVFDSDSSMDEILSKYKEKRLEIKDSNTKEKKMTAPPVDINDLKFKLRKKFENNGVVKDEMGTIIDVDKVLNNLDKFSEKTLKTIRRVCKGTGPFEPLAIRKLSEVQGSYAKFEHMFTIERLNDPQQIKEEFEKRREYPNYLKYEYRCEKCIKGYQYKKRLDYHVKKYHDESVPFECELCHMHLRTKRRLTKHIMATHSMVYKCKLCTDFISNNRSSMMDHHRRHKGGKYVCERCGKDFVSRTTYYAHVNTHEPQNICELCACAFSKPKGLSQHKCLKHHNEEFVESELNKKCDDCNITFLTEDVFKKHLSVSHKPETRKGHPGKKGVKVTYSCRLCDWKGHGLLMRMQHYAAEHPEGDKDQSRLKYLCPDCGKRFQHFGDYKHHMNKHAGVRPYACTKCPKTFYHPNTLNMHMQRHLPPTHACPHCGKMFTTTTGLAAHVRIHINDRRYKCDICGKGFIHASSLKEHVNGVHFNIRRKKPRQRETENEYFE